MTECCYGFLCKENLVTYGAVLTLGKTCLGTGGSYCIVDYLGVTERVSVISNVAVATYRTSISGITTVFTIRSSYYCVIRVTCCGNCLLCNENLVTYRAMLTLSKTGCSTGRCYCLVNNLGVTGCGNNSLVKYFTTVCTYLASGKTGGGTGCGSACYRSGVGMLAGKICITSVANFVVVLVKMAKSVYYFLSNKKLATHRAVLTFSKAGFSTSCRYCSVNCFSMAGCGNDYVISGKLNATNGTVNYAVIVTCVLTGRCNALLYNCFTYGMAVCRNYLLSNENLVTYGTMLTGGKTGCGTSRSYCLVGYLSVTERGNSYIISGKLNVTYGTVNYVVIATVSLTSRINVVFYNGVACSVSKCCYSFLNNESLATYGTMLTFGKTGLGTSGSLCLVNNLGMSERIGVISNVAVTTYGTDVSGVTAVYTVGGGYLGVVGMLDDCDILSISVRSIILTYVGHSTLLCTSGSKSLSDNIVMLKSRYLSLLGKNSIAHSASYSVGKSLCSASGSDTGNNHLKVALSRYLFLRNDYDTARGAFCAVAKTGLGAGRHLALNCNLGMTECIRIITNVAVATR